MGKKLRTVLVGCGNIAKAWLDPVAAFEDVEIVGLVDLKEENALRWKDKFKLDGALVGTDIKAMLKKTKPDIVFDCTIPCAHCNVTVTALDFGCHVLGEKPMAETIEDARKMVAAAKRNKKLYAVIQNRRYAKQIVGVRDTLRSGILGNLTTLNADFYIGAHFGGFRDQMDHVLLVDMAIHSFDQARFLCGKDPVSVYCHEWNPPGSWYRHGASAQCIFEMSDGLIFNYRGSWCSEGLNTTWECDWRAIGENGSLLWDGGDQVKAQAVAGTKGFSLPKANLELPTPSDLTHSGHGGVIRDFLDAVKNGSEPQTVCTDNIKSVAMVIAAVKSAESGKKVKIAW